MGGGKNRRQRGPRQLSSTVRLDRRTIWTENAVPGTAVYGESLRRFSGAAHRRWDPSRSAHQAGPVRTSSRPRRHGAVPRRRARHLGEPSLRPRVRSVKSLFWTFGRRGFGSSVPARSNLLGRGATGVGSGAGRCPPARRLGRSFAQTSAVAVSRRGASGPG